MSLKSSWERLLDTLEEYCSFGNLRPGASQKEIKHLEEQLGFKLTDELSQLLLIANGEEPASNGEVLSGVRLLSTEEILARHNDLLSMVEEGIISVDEEGSDQYEKYDRRMSGQTWRPGWVVFGEQNSFLDLITDHVPADDGKKGQVFFRTTCQSVRGLQANSIKEFLDKYERLATSTNTLPSPLDVPYLVDGK